MTYGTYTWSPNKIIGWLLAFTIAAGLTVGIRPLRAAATDSFASGTGAVHDPYIIKTAEELQKINDFLDAGHANKLRRRSSPEPQGYRATNGGQRTGRRAADGTFRRLLAGAGEPASVC